MIEVPTGGRLIWDVVELDPDDVARFGGKGAGLARMERAGISVPPAFVIGTDAFRAYYAAGEQLPGALIEELDRALERLERQTGKSFGAHGPEPLLVSVRSGAAISMPGMMDTVLNLGLDARGAAAFAKVMGDVGFAIDTWLRFWRMFGEIVLSLDTAELERAMGEARGHVLADPSAARFEALEGAIVRWIEERGAPAETRPLEQLRLAIAAVFGSWHNRRARAYRKNQGISDELGTAVTIQAMVFGNRDGRSGSGVAFSCNPNTGERGLFGEYVVGRQGEDLVAGTATPIDLSDPGAIERDLHAALSDHARRLEQLYRDAIDIEFTVEAGRLYLLQVRAAKRTAEAAVRIAVDLMRDGAIGPEEAVRRVTTTQLAKLLRPTFDRDVQRGAEVLTKGIPSSPGHASGAAILDADRAAERVEAGEHVILLRPTTSPQDIRGMLSADGIVTARGGALSHAAVVSRALDKPCIVGCESIDIDLVERTFAVAGRPYPEGTALSIDGESGSIYLGTIPVIAGSGGSAELAELVRAAQTVSGVHASLAAIEFSEIQAARAADEPIVAGVTDLLIAAGTIDRLTAAIGRLAEDGARDGTAAEIEELACAIARRAFAIAPNARIAFRLPSFLSERARQIVPAWAALPAQSLLPLGEEGLYVPLVRGIAAGAREAGAADRFSVLLSGATEVSELTIFRRDLAGAGVTEAGAVVRSFAGLHNFAGSTSCEGDVWVDLDSIARGIYGFPSELFSTPGAFERYRERGCLTFDPQKTPPPILIGAFAALVRGLGAERVGAIVGSSWHDEMSLAFYEAGCRRFAVSANSRERLLLAFGRYAAGGSQ